ncbi:hypothetical protein FDENT_10159 [Fusarium denticulatum]|uniref:Uncharacterized protein n=1 Tax=Fusarium denticulatum TaxID=48507 RepID=A0A8H5TKM2_9HYPO|nr:hypothetical protein FDENT_10159 [Fusarium denticulatum]
MDPNKNRTQMVYDALGQSAPLARLGKVGKKQDVTAFLPGERLVSLIQGLSTMGRIAEMLVYDPLNSTVVKANMDNRKENYLFKCLGSVDTLMDVDHSR